MIERCVAVVVCASLIGVSGAFAEPPARPGPSPASSSVTPGRELLTESETLPAAPPGSFTPPACTGIFLDVPCPGGFAVNWIEQLYNDGITAGCGGGDYCPDNPVTRAQMAVFLEKAVRGTGNWPAHTVLVWAVKTSGGAPDSVASGQALLTGINSIPTTGPDMPESNNHWVVKVGPGDFNIGALTISLPSYVTLEGSGREATYVENASAGLPTLLVSGGTQVAARSLSLANGGGYFAVRVMSGSGLVPSALTLEDAMLLVSGGTNLTVLLAADYCTINVLRTGFWGDPGSTGVYLQGGSSGVLVRDSDLQDVGTPTYLGASSASSTITLYNDVVGFPGAPGKAAGTYYCAGNVHPDMSAASCP